MTSAAEANVPVRARPKGWWFAGCGALAIAAALGIFLFLKRSGEVSMQRRSAVDLRTVSGFVDAYATDNGFYPPATGPEELREALTLYSGGRATGPEDASPPVFSDEWGRPIRYQCWKTNADAKGCDAYALVSAGRDGVFEQTDARKYTRGVATDPDHDLVLINGALIREPPEMPL